MGGPAGDRRDELATWDDDDELATWGAQDAPGALPSERIALVDLLDRVLAEGVVVTGEITLSVADVDLVMISVRALLTSVSTLIEKTLEDDEPDE